MIVATVEERKRPHDKKEGPVEGPGDPKGAKAESTRVFINFQAEPGLPYHQRFHSYLFSLSNMTPNIATTEHWYQKKTLTIKVVPLLYLVG
eukprot:scaffold147346_cov53-Cyclotella_meneghiniana.AAC.3